MSSNVTRKSLRVQTRAAARKRTLVMSIVLALLAAVLVPVTGQAAWAGTGSRVSGVAWADVNRDGVRTADEALRAGVTVELLGGPTGPVLQTTTTAANGTYQFINIADGANYHVRVVAPGAFRFPDTASGQNDFRRAEVPTTGNPERGIFGPFSVTGAQQHPGIDAGLSPVANLILDDLDNEEGCEGLATTGEAPWDPAPGPGLDTGTADCIVRVGDTVQQDYSVNSSVVREGVTISNVVIEFTIRPVSNPNDPSDVADSRISLFGPLAQGLPDGCNTGAGFSPSSSVTTAADGTMTVICNTGNAQATVTTVSLMWGFADNSPIPGFAQVTARAYTGTDEAAPAVEVKTGPVIEVTGRAQWEAKKSLQNGPIREYRTFDGVSQLGFAHYYWVDVNNMLGDGGSELQWPVTLYDRMTAFPNARIVYCKDRIPTSDVNNADWTISCPLNTPQTTNPDGSVRGWPITITKPANSRWESTHILVGTWVPVADAYRTIQPDWEVGDQPPAGTVAWENHITETNGWHLVGGQPNTPPGGVGPGFEAGWDGTTATGDNVVPRQFETGAPSWDLVKGTWQGTTWVDGATDNNPATPAVPGWTASYVFDYRETGGSLITPLLDDVRIKDFMTEYPDAVLLSCNASNPNYGTPTCETGAQPSDGWDMSIAPSGFADRDKRFLWYATFFIPTPTIPDPCRANVNDTLSFRNEARETDGLMADGWLQNNSGLEPGWNGTTASGNNVATHTFNVRSRIADCGTLDGDKQYEGITGGLNNWNQFSPGDVVNSHVWTSGSNERISLTNPMVCDVFDVSVWRVSGNPLAPIAGADPNPHIRTVNAGGVNPADYVIEYAVGSNTVDTQAGSNNRTLINTPNVTDARGCRTHQGPWTSDPAGEFGADWRDEVNMVRVRAIDPTLVETGPFTLGLYVPLQARWQYNGGPNAGEDIPAGIRMNNTGGFYDFDGNTRNIIWTTVSRQLVSTLPLLGNKSFANAAGTAWMDDGTVASGQLVESRTELAADALTQRHTVAGTGFRAVQAPGAEDQRGFPVDNPMVCDNFDISVFALDGPARMEQVGIDNPAGYVIEYAIGSNAVDTQTGPRVGGLFPVDRSSLVDDNDGCRDGDIQWETNPANFGADWRDQVNMVRIRPIDPDHTEYAGFNLRLLLPLVARSFYNGGPNDGEAILTGVRLSNVGGWSSGMRGDEWTTMQRETRYQGMRLAVAKTAGATAYVPGADAIWNISIGINDAAVGAVMENVELVDTVPVGTIYNDQCTRSRLPAGVTVDYNPATRQVTFNLGDITATARDYWVRNGATALQLCTTVESIAQPGDTYVNNVQATSPSSENAPTASANTRAGGTGQMGLTKAVDKPFVATGETYTWSMEWANTSTTINFNAPDLIDVLPWNGDGEAGVGSERGQFSSDYEGAATLAGPLALPTYVRGGTGAGAPAVGSNVPGTWYYSVADPRTLNHDPRHASNADPATAGGTWLTAAEVTDFDDVTAVRFVSAGQLRATQRVIARVPMVSTSDDLNNVYVNRAQIFSSTFPNQPLLSTEPYVLMPGFTLGDFVWLDRNGNGRFDTGEQGAAGVSIEVLNEDGDVVTTATTNAQGRWSVAKIPAGTYTVRIPAEMFQAGGPLDNFVVRTVNSGTSDLPNERTDNNNIPTPNPAQTGLTSTPVTLSYDYNGERLVGANGPTGDDVARLAPALIPDTFSTFTVDLALMPEPGVDIEKHTNGQDADAPTGPNVTVGGDVRWTYIVTNTGGVNLTNVTVTDDKVDAADIDCGNGTNVVAGPLAPGATFTCVANGTATAGQYENLGTVTGLDPTAVEVTDEDLSHYFGIEPDVDIEKFTNGQDADDPTGPNVTVGGGVRWTYEVTNTGNTPLTNVTVTDDMVAAADIDCGNGSNVIPGPLAPGDSFTCVAEGTATIGQYTNLGTVVGTAPATTDVNGNTVAGVIVDDEDRSHYFGIQPTVDIEKHTNGQDADGPTGPLVAVGGEVHWTYIVTNTGNVPLTDVTVSDDVEPDSSIDCDGTGSNVIDGPLAPGESFTCVATGEATEGQYRNLGTVTGIGPETTDVEGETVPGAEVTDDDLSHYFGIVPDVDIEKHTNGQDADDPTGPNVTVNGQVRWMYIVTNSGNVPLTNIEVTDNVEPADSIDCSGTGSNVITGPLAPGESFTCVASGTATLGQYANIGTVTAVGPEATDMDGNPVPGVTVEDEDRSHYFGVQPSIDIEKATNTHDADAPIGPVIGRGGDVVWTYVVTNTGNVTLTDVTVTDNVESADSIDCGDGSNVIGELEAGDSVECTATGEAIVGQYANLGSVTGVGPESTDVDGNTVAGTPVADEDWSHYFGVDASIDIEKFTNGQDADEETGPLVAAGDPVRWTYVVTNTGTTPLTDVTVTDDVESADLIDCAGTGSNVVPGPLAPGESFTCVAEGIATEGQYRNVGTVVGTGPEVTDADGTVIDGVEVTDADLAHYFGVAPRVDIEKATNGEDADEPTGPSILIGDEVEWTYVVTNNGNVPLTDLVVTDNVEAAESIDCAETRLNTFAGPLAPGESFTCVARGTATEGQYANLGTVTAVGPETTDVEGNPVPGAEVTDEDWSHYFGTTEPVPTPNGEPPVDEELPPVVRNLLAHTGGAAGILPLSLGALLLGGGLLVILMVRRKRKEETTAE